jgi:hypothetical protein
MPVKAQYISKKRDGVTWCYPSTGYFIDTEIDEEEYEKIDTVDADLPESDESFPKGAPFQGYFKIGSKILKKKGEITKEDVQKRVDDWISRIENVFSLVKYSLSNHSNIDFVETKKNRMHEELMQKFNVPPVNLPVLEIRKNKELLASFSPKGLWVIGANGRIDILTKYGSYILVDISDKYQQSIWKVYAPSNRKKSIDFDKEFVETLVQV